MSESYESRSNVQKAAAFFRQPVWSRLLEALYDKYMSQGRIGGQIVLRDCTVEEQREIARFLKRKLPLRSDVTVRLSDFQGALNESGFACELPLLLMALFPERSHTTRAEQRAKLLVSQQWFYEALTSVIEGLPNGSNGQQWLLYGEHGRDELFRRYKNEPQDAQEQLLHHVWTTANALNQLPSPPIFERLSIFAQRISGDPHYFDGNTPAGRIFFRALMDLARRGFPILHTEPKIENDEQGSEVATELSEQSHHRLLVYYEAGLLLDTISSTVAVFHLISAEDLSGLSDALVKYAGERILTLSLRQLLAWKNLQPASKHIYLFENPQVFEVVVDELQHFAGKMVESQKPMLPTLVCTSGWPSMAVIRLLNLLTESSSDITLYYSGDFDIQGLRIAHHLITRYSGRCVLWHFDPASYLTALHSKAAELSAADISGLQTLPELFTPLTAVIREKNKKAYQEGITQLLLQEIQDAYIV